MSNLTQVRDTGGEYILHKLIDLRATFRLKRGADGVTLYTV